MTSRPASERPYFAPPRPRVIAHRGLATGAPENTIAAFRAALDAGATHIETDVQATLDGVPVVLHDPDLRRVLGDPGAAALVSTLTLAELRGLAGERLAICTLAEALQTLPSALFNIDVKAEGAVRGTAETIERLGAHDRVLITSFSDRRRRAALRLLGDVATSASAVTVLPVVLACRLGLVALARILLRGIDAVQIPERILGIRTTTPLMVSRMRRAGVEVHVWTVNAVDDMRRLLDAGVDGIVSDRCDLLAEVVRSR